MILSFPIKLIFKSFNTRLILHFLKLPLNTAQLLFLNALFTINCMKFICSILLVLCFFTYSTQAQWVSSLYSLQPPASNEHIVLQMPLVNKSNTVILNWQVTQLPLKESYFIIERSTDEVHFETIATLKATITLLQYTYTDESPIAGNSSYRIRFIHQDTFKQESLPKTVFISGAPVGYKFYPNPVGNMLLVNIEYPAQIQILDAAGLIKISTGLNKGINAIDCSNLPKGNYLLKLAPSQSSRGFTDKLIKN